MMNFDPFTGTMQKFHQPPRQRKSRNTKPTKLSNALEIVDLLSAVFTEASKAYNFAKNTYNRLNSYSVKVTERDMLYGDVHRWLMEVLPEEKHKSLEVASNRHNYDTSPEDSSAGPRVDPLEIRFNDRAERHLVIDGHKIIVRLITPETAGGEKAMEMMWRDAKNEIVFVARSYTGQKAIIAQLEKLNQKRATSRKAVLKMLNQWNSWQTRSDLPPRTMSSVALPEDQKERIVTDIRRFLDAEGEYNRLALPWHRGYMLYGPPGTGKTSLVKAIANEFNLDLWYVSLADLKTEQGLLNLLSNVGPRSILLLEDIDTLRITHDRDSTEPGTISMGSLLNILDGVATPHGLITFMTTNRFEILDPALTRAGRMDLIEKLDYPSKSTIQAMFKHFYGDANPPMGMAEDAFSSREISTSQISEIMKRHLDNPKQAATDIKKLLK